MEVVVATHGHCFDGLASATLFTWLLSELRGAKADFHYVACGYGPGHPGAPESCLSGDENALLDYRFTASSRLHWYFDHHRTAFGSEQDRAYFAAQQPDRHYFFDPDYSSCAKLIFDTAQTRFGLDPAPLQELAQWADVVDSARFESAEAAIDRSEPVMRLVSVTEHHGSADFMKRFVKGILKEGISAVAASREVEQFYGAIGKSHDAFRSAVKRQARADGRVVLVDLTEQSVDTLGKFVTYALYPEAVFSVVAARIRRGYKISVGYNPWCGKPLDTDISAICARYGGGGHKVVGGISLPEGEGDRAREIARTIAQELR